MEQTAESIVETTKYIANNFMKNSDIPVFANETNVLLHKSGKAIILVDKMKMQEERINPVVPGD